MAVSTTTPVLLVTANVGSIFEDPSVMLKIWTEEFLNTISRLDPKFIALHCQEVGGKNYEESMKHVEYFVKLLMESEELRLFDKVRVYLDEDYSSAENFTALGNFYFIHNSISEVLIWDFKELCFVAVEGKEVHAGDIEEVSTKEKSKFPQDFFPECKWSRKGFMRTRWNLNGTVFDLVNIHLFHDASNFVAMEAFPSVYSKTRQRALEYTLDRFHNDIYGPAPFFLFGDFNFRTDTQGVVQKLSDGLDQVKVNNNKKLEYKDADSQVVLTLGKKEFSHQKHQSLFIDDDGLWLKEYDKELEGFSGQLFEFPISFPPSYPFVEDSRVSCEYMPTRCPAWCDRVLLSPTATPLVYTENGDDVEYSLIGRGTCMGDHKPVLLSGGVVCGAGRLSCCESWLMHGLPSVPSTIEEKSDASSESGEVGEGGVRWEVGGGAGTPGPMRKRRLSRERLVSESGSGGGGGANTTQRYLVKRVHSASIVEVKVGLVREASCWRSRSVSVSAPRPPSLPRYPHSSSSRVRLISREDLLQRPPLPRLQSHHSSSDEDWFEEIDTPPPSPAPTPPPSTTKHRHPSNSSLDNKCCILS